jgi:hypothetical protein
MILEAAVSFQIGDRVRVKQDVKNELFFDAGHPHSVVLNATAGSTGVVVSVDDFAAGIGHSLQSPYIQSQQEFMEQGLRYPVQFETVAPSSDPDVGLDCRVGRIIVLPAAALEKLSS